MLIVTCAIIIRESTTVVREIKEELHLDIEVMKRLKPVEHDYPTFRIRLVPFIANVVGGKLLLEEHADAEWITVDDLDQYDWAPADVPIVEQLKADALWK